MGYTLTLLAIAAALTLGIVQASFFEWTFHRFWLHKPWLPDDCFRAHTLVHHQLCKFEDTFEVVDAEQEEALTFTWYGGPIIVAANILPWALIVLGLSLAGVSLPYTAFLVTFGVTIALYYVAYEGLHFLMHKPMSPWIENSAYFKFIKRHHVIHHVQMDRNLNVLIPLADYCFGTLVLERPETAPRKTTEAARRTARANSRFGRRIEHKERDAEA
jgi:hypothetical protein